ncbi:hypothetical protein DFS34DRAFT_594535 [Phlyctochytrium arcticum]|nr:hypothetical protein DFS34DRAFT_594535 [Phlyctochytrium arcticum]
MSGLEPAIQDKMREQVNLRAQTFPTAMINAHLRQPSKTAKASNSKASRASVGTLIEAIFTEISSLGERKESKENRGSGCRGQNTRKGGAPPNPLSWALKGTLNEWEYAITHPITKHNGDEDTPTDLSFLDPLYKRFLEKNPDLATYDGREFDESVEKVVTSKLWNERKRNRSTTPGGQGEDGADEAAAGGAGANPGEEEDTRGLHVYSYNLDLGY